MLSFMSCWARHLGLCTENAFGHRCGENLLLVPFTNLEEKNSLLYVILRWQSLHYWLDFTKCSEFHSFDLWASLLFPPGLTCSFLLFPVRKLSSVHGSWIQLQEELSTITGT